MNPGRAQRIAVWWNRRLENWFEHIRQHEEQTFLLLTLLIGALVGLSVVGFIIVTERLGSRLYPAAGAPWRRILMPVGGSLGMGYLLFRYFPDARGSGVPQTKAALFARGGKITLGTILGKFFCTSATLASGIPLGREGPAVQVGAGIASVLGRRLGLSQEKVKALLPVGASAAIAAAFNTPMAAVLFALEEIMGNLHAPVLGSVVLAAATSWMVLRLVLGNEPLFHVPEYRVVHPLEFGLYALLGLAGGLVSVAFTKLLLRMRHWFLRMPSRTLWFQPVAGGLLVGGLGWFVPQLLGVGYGHVGDALNGRMALQLMALLLILKLMTVTVSYASGNAGGIFGPSLFMGAMLGGVMGSVAHKLAPDFTATPGAYALVGMGTTFAGIVRAPMTSVMMIFEVTRDYAIIVPLMISNLVSFFVSVRFQPQPTYEALARQDGIHLPAAAARERQAGRRVAQVMRATPDVLSAEMTAAEAVERTQRGTSQAWLVTNEGGLLGIVTTGDLAKAIREGTGGKRLAEMLDPRDFPHIHDDQSLDLALERMGAASLDLLPVVGRANIRELEGVILLRDILGAYGVGRPPLP
jgi:CIC family chloride channel protein